MLWREKNEHIAEKVNPNTHNYPWREVRKVLTKDTMLRQGAHSFAIPAPLSPHTCTGLSSTSWLSQNSVSHKSEADLPGVKGRCPWGFLFWRLWEQMCFLAFPSFKRPSTFLDLKTPFFPHSQSHHGHTEPFLCYGHKVLPSLPRPRLEHIPCFKDLHLLLRSRRQNENLSTKPWP